MILSYMISMPTPITGRQLVSNYTVTKNVIYNMNIYIVKNVMIFNLYNSLYFDCALCFF